MELRDDPLRGRGPHRDDHVQPARPAQRDQPADDRRAARGLRRGRGRRRRCGRSWSPATGGRSAPAPTSTEIPDDGRVIYDEPYLSTLPAVGGAAGGHAAVPDDDQADHHRRQRAVLRRRPRLGHHRRHHHRVGPGRVLRPPREHRAGVGPRDGAPRPGAAHQHRHAHRAHRPPRAHERAAGLRARDDLRGRRARPARSSGRTRSPALVNRNAPLAVRGTRLAIRKGLDLPLHEAEILAEAFRERVVRTDDAKEGPRPSSRSATRSGRADERRRYETIRYETSADQRRHDHARTGPRC